MERINGRLANTANGLIILLIAGYLGNIGQAIIVPIIFGIIISFLLYPICAGFEKLGFPRVLAIITTMFGIFLIIAGILTIFSTQFAVLFDDFGKFRLKINDMIQKLLVFMSSVSWIRENMDSMMEQVSSNLLSFSQKWVGNTIVTSTLFLGYTLMVVVYVFLFLLYRSAFKDFVISQFKAENKEHVRKIIYKSQQLVQSYVAGLMIVIVILGTMTSMGLYFIGIEHAVLFGFFAALLNIIPYVGTTIGGTLPFLFALLNYDELWKPIAVVVLYQVVQTLEGNFITPKIVGNKVSINPLIAIVVLIIGGFYWGIAGMVLSIPLTAILKLVFDNIDSMKPYGHLLGSGFWGSGSTKPKPVHVKVFDWVSKRKKPKP